MTAPLLRDDLRGAQSPTEPRDDRTHRAPPIVRGVRAAFAFFTRIPVGGFPYEDRELAWAPAHAPLVGGVLGAALGALDTYLLPLGAFPAATLVVGVSMLLTGALHEDGLADTSDALGGGHDASKVFAILKDSRIGSFGAAAIAISVLARAALLGQLAQACFWALPLAWCAARVGPVWLMVLLPYVTPAQTAKSESIVRANWRQAMVASAWFFGAAALAIGQGWIAAPRAGLAAAAIAVITILTGWRYHRRIGGLTGDFLGATEQLGEIATLAVLAWPS
ncbi:MAG TPA: adenosylcobinamide-GDP ribazoletransferase [Polyangiaceae bacterium]|nr:adenosylcobinamide-GDP ribazoletransferase [Polyangiaceae bacterium]